MNDTLADILDSFHKIIYIMDSHTEHECTNVPSNEGTEAVAMVDPNFHYYLCDTQSIDPGESQLSISLLSEFESHMFCECTKPSDTNQLPDFPE